MNCSCHGSFSAAKQYEVVVGRGQYLELLSISAAGAITSRSMRNVFGLIKQVAAFRLPGQSVDYLIVTSDSGRLVILEYDEKRSDWKKTHQETYGKTGLRRAVPSEYLATDPKGRAIMIGAIEKQKFVYCPRRDEANLTISSPLIAHKSNTITYAVIGLDVGYENPVFAALEVDHSALDEDSGIETAEKHLVFYEYDLGLNHVVRKSPWQSSPLPASANLLFEVPEGKMGPGGVLVCCESFIYYMNTGHTSLREVLPRRQTMGHPSNGLMLVSGDIVKNVPHKGSFFYLLQSEVGDLYKINLIMNSAKDMVQKISIQYFDTIPVATNIMITRSGFLFAASESANHSLYKFVSLEPSDPIIGAMTVPLPNGQQDIFPLFNPKSLANLELKTEVKSLAPLLNLQVSAESESKKFYALCGRGARSSLRTLQHGLSLGELGNQQFQGTPQQVWTLKKNYNADTDDYIVVSFINATMVFSIGDTIQEVHDANLLSSTPTLYCCTMADDSIVQIYPNGIRHIKKDRRVVDWSTSGVKPIVACDANQRQVVVALGTAELVYFELDSHGSVTQVDKKQLNKEVTCLSIGPIPKQSIRSKFLAVGCEKIVQILSLEVEDKMTTLARQQCGADISGIAIVDMENQLGQPGLSENLCMFIGCVNGIVVRSVIDGMKGEITDSRPRFCGTHPCKLVKTKVGGRHGIMVLSSRSWLAYFHHDTYCMSPLTVPSLEHVASMSVDACPEALVALSEKDLVVYAFEELGVTFNQQITDLNATPRGFATHPFLNTLIVIESDHRSYTEEEKAVVKQV